MKKIFFKILCIFFILIISTVSKIDYLYSQIVPEKSPYDKRQYEALELSNGLKVLFIDDKDVEKSAYTLSVNTGSSYNPPRSLGLAHYLEHMLFLGSEKYPLESSYPNFIR